MRIKNQNIYIRTPKTNYYIGSESFGKYMYSGLMSTRNKIVDPNLEVLRSQEEFEDTKGVIRIRKSKKDRQYNGQAK
jgi:hypothetical protein